MLPSTASTAARPPSIFTQWSSKKPTFCGASSNRDGTNTGLSPASRARSVARAERLAERTDANVAAASTSVPPAVASAEIVVQSATGAILKVFCWRRRRAPALQVAPGEAPRHEARAQGHEAAHPVTPGRGGSRRSHQAVVLGPHAQVDLAVVGEVFDAERIHGNTFRFGSGGLSPTGSFVVPTRWAVG